MATAFLAVLPLTEFGLLKRGNMFRTDPMSANTSRADGLDRRRMVAEPSYDLARG